MGTSERYVCWQTSQAMCMSIRHCDCTGSSDSEWPLQGPPALHRMCGHSGLMICTGIQAACAGIEAMKSTGVKVLLHRCLGTEVADSDPSRAGTTGHKNSFQFDASGSQLLPHKFIDLMFNVQHPSGILLPSRIPHPEKVPMPRDDLV
jgi:hypothetical protein